MIVHSFFEVHRKTLFFICFFIFLGIVLSTGKYTSRTIINLIDFRWVYIIICQANTANNRLNAQFASKKQLIAPLMDVSIPSVFDASENGPRVKILALFAERNFCKFDHKGENTQLFLLPLLLPDADSQPTFSMREESSTSPS